MVTLARSSLLPLTAFFVEFIQISISYDVFI